jgi:hypothetical protein
MAGPLLQTKFHVPRRRRGHVARPRLSERLIGGMASTLTLVSAPAGFGYRLLPTSLRGEAARGVEWDHRGILPLTPDRRSQAITISLLAGLRTHHELCLVRPR